MLDCLLLLLDRLLLGFRMLIIGETGIQGVLQLCDLTGGRSGAQPAGTGGGARRRRVNSAGAAQAPAAARHPPAHAPDPASRVAGWPQAGCRGMGAARGVHCGPRPPGPAYCVLPVGRWAGSAAGALQVLGGGGGGEAGPAAVGAVLFQRVRCGCG